MSQPEPYKDWPHPYERPNENWICGRIEAGLPCRLGPDQRGRCRTTVECTPALEVKPGETKGHYRCTRPAEFGGPCSEGPLPSGACGHATVPCSPTRSWRNRRGVFTWWIIGLTIASLLLLLGLRTQFRFANPGPVSTAHSQPRAGLRHGASVGDNNCGACHAGATEGLQRWVQNAAAAKPGIFNFAGFVDHSSFAVTAMDRKCSDCHTGRNFHHAIGVAEQISCLSCHIEHEGDAGLHARSGSECARCHGDKDYLLAYAKGGNGSRPTDQRMGLVTTFSKDHPEFSVLAGASTDTNSLRFNHQLHLSSSVMSAEGRQLQCSDCHERDAAGAFHRPIKFEQHCQECHSLQFDPMNPELHLPHGEVRFAQAFLASLPEQFERFGRDVRKITEQRALATFVEENMRRMEQAQLQGENLRQKVFFNRDRSTAGSSVGTIQAGQRASFYGCAFCHEVSGTALDPHVTVPGVPLRWLRGGSFHHLSHQSIACQSCHNVQPSTKTADILLPSVRSCTACHNTRSAPGESCVLCHNYHRSPAAL